MPQEGSPGFLAVSGPIMLSSRPGQRVMVLRVSPGRSIVLTQRRIARPAPSWQPVRCRFGPRRWSLTSEHILLSLNQASRLPGMVTLRWRRIHHASCINRQAPHRDQAVPKLGALCS